MIQTPLRSHHAAPVPHVVRAKPRRRDGLYAPLLLVLLPLIALARFLGSRTTLFGVAQRAVMGAAGGAVVEPPIYRSSNQWFGQTDSLSLNKPTGTVEGDVLVAGIRFQGASPTVPPNPPPSGTPTTIDTTLHNTAYLGAGRKIVRNPVDNRLWVVFYNASDYEFWYSDDDGDSWSQNTNATISDADTYGPSIFVDLDGHAHAAYVDTAGDVQYRRAPDIGPTTAWDAATLVKASTYLNSKVDCVAHREGTGWKCHIVAFGDLYTVDIDSGGTKTVTDHGGYAGGSAAQAVAIDFHHTGDGVTVQGGTPHLYLSYYKQSNGIFFQKVSYNAGAWTLGSERMLSNDLSQVGYFSNYFDGTRIVTAARPDANTTIIKVWERDAADTTTTPRVPPATGTGVNGVGVAHHVNDNIILVMLQSTLGQDPAYVVYDRSTNSWGSWTVTFRSGEAVNFESLNVARHPFGGMVDFSYVLGAATDTVMHVALDPSKDWVLLETAVGSTHCYVWYKMVGDSEPASYQWSWSGGRDVGGIIVAVQGGGVPDVSSAFYDNNSSFSIPATGITTVVDNSYLGVFHGFYFWENPPTFSPPSGFTKREEFMVDDRNQGVGIGLQYSDGIHELAGATGDKVATLTSSESERTAVLLSIPPA